MCPLPTILVFPLLSLSLSLSPSPSPATPHFLSPPLPHFFFSRYQLLLNILSPLAFFPFFPSCRRFQLPIQFFLTRLMQAGHWFLGKPAGSSGFWPSYYKDELKDVTKLPSWPVPYFYSRTNLAGPVLTTIVLLRGGDAEPLAGLRYWWLCRYAACDPLESRFHGLQRAG